MSLELPRLYLAVSSFPDDEASSQLAAICDSVDLAALRIDTTQTPKDRLAQLCDSVRTIATPRDIAVTVLNNVELVQQLGLDGVHLSHSSASVADLRQTLGDDAIIGSFCALSRHDAMIAAEQGADYVSLGYQGAIDDQDALESLLSFWTDAIEVPVVAEGVWTPDLIRACSDKTDFFFIGDEIWASHDPVAHVIELANARRIA